MDFPSPETLVYTWHSRIEGAVRAAGNLDELKSVVSKAFSDYDNLFDRGMIATRSAIACRSGCAFCCYLKVDVSPPEVFILADYLRARVSDTDRAEVHARARDNSALIRPMILEQHWAANLPCPLLKDGRCSAYEVRPMPCRRCHSVSVDPCKDGYEHPEVIAPPVGVPLINDSLLYALGALNKAFSDQGYDMESYDLNPALVEALKDDSAALRWSRKERAFAKSALAKDYARQRRGRIGYG